MGTDAELKAVINDKAEALTEKIESYKREMLIAIEEHNTTKILSAITALSNRLSAIESQLNQEPKVVK